MFVFAHLTGIGQVTHHEDSIQLLLSREVLQGTWNFYQRSATDSITEMNVGDYGKRRILLRQLRNGYGYVLGTGTAYYYLAHTLRELTQVLHLETIYIRAGCACRTDRSYPFRTLEGRCYRTGYFQREFLNVGYRQLRYCRMYYRSTTQLTNRYLTADSVTKTDRQRGLAFFAATICLHRQQYIAAIDGYCTPVGIYRRE